MGKRRKEKGLREGREEEEENGKGSRVIPPIQTYFDSYQWVNPQNIFSGCANAGAVVVRLPRFNLTRS